MLVWFPVNQAGPDPWSSPSWNFSSKSLEIQAGEAGVQISAGHSQAPCSAPAVMEPSQTNVPDLQLTSKLPSWNCSLGWIPKGTLWKEAQWCPLDVIAKSRAAFKRLAHLAEPPLEGKPGLDLLRAFTLLSSAAVPLISW